MRQLTITAIVLTCTTTSGALGQEPMFPQQYPTFKGVPATPSRSTLEELTSYPAEFVKSLERPDATNPELFKQLPRNFPVVRLTQEWGGNLADHRNRFMTMAANGQKVEVINHCPSACTVVLTYVSKDNLCFSPNGTLWFHQARQRDGTPVPSATKELYDGYPADIRAWIDRQGGWQAIPYDGWLKLWPDELWKMGYKRCSPG